MNKNIRQARTARTARPAWSPRFTLADRVLAQGQHFRADEAVVALSLALTFSAKWQQATRGAR